MMMLSKSLKVISPIKIFKIQLLLFLIVLIDFIVKVLIENGDISTGIHVHNGVSIVNHYSWAFSFSNLGYNIQNISKLLVVIEILLIIVFGCLNMFVKVFYFPKFLSISLNLLAFGFAGEVIDRLMNANNISHEFNSLEWIKLTISSNYNQFNFSDILILTGIVALLLWLLVTIIKIVIN